MNKLIGIYWEDLGISFHRSWTEATLFKAEHADVGESTSPYDIDVTKWIYDRVMRDGDWMSKMKDRHEARNYCPVTTFIKLCQTDTKSMALIQD